MESEPNCLFLNSHTTNTKNYIQEQTGTLVAVDATMHKKFTRNKSTFCMLATVGRERDAEQTTGVF